MKINILLQNYKKSLLLGVIILCFGHSALAQRVAISTDVIDWATASINAGVELRVSSRITLGLDIVCNPFPKMPFFSDLRLTNTTATMATLSEPPFSMGTHWCCQNDGILDSTQE